MHLYQNQFAGEHDLAFEGRPKKILVIASTPRCGSHMLGHALHSTGHFGFPLEYANPMNLDEWKNKFGVSSFAEVIAKLKQTRTSPNGVFAIKVHYEHIKEFGGFDAMQRMLPNAYFVLLTRGNLLDQAISHSIAMQTGVWIAGQQAIAKEAEYRYQGIDFNLKRLIKFNASWTYLLSTISTPFMTLNFDEVKSNLSQTIVEIAELMDVELPTSSIPDNQVTKRQSNSLNKEWRRKYLAEHETNELYDKPSVTMASVRSKIKRYINK